MSRAYLPQNDDDTDNVHERETEEMCDRVILRLFNSHNEDVDFCGFSVQEEDKGRHLRLIDK